MPITKDDIILIKNLFMLKGYVGLVYKLLQKLRVTVSFDCRPGIGR